MESLAAVRQPRRHEEPQLQLLLADADAGLRSLMAARAREVVDGLVVCEAEDGAEAVEIGLQGGVQLAVLDVSMPRLGGIEVALTLRELRPRMRLALQTVEPHAHRDRARECRLPLFDKLRLDRAFVWVERQAQSLFEPRLLQQRRSLSCSACGYGIACAVPPERCPMCRREGTWIHSARRPFSADRRFA